MCLVHGLSQETMVRLDPFASIYSCVLGWDRRISEGWGVPAINSDNMFNPGNGLEQSPQDHDSATFTEHSKQKRGVFPLIEARPLAVYFTLPLLFTLHRDPLKTAPASQTCPFLRRSTHNVTGHAFLYKAPWSGMIKTYHTGDGDY